MVLHSYPPDITTAYRHAISLLEKLFHATSTATSTSSTTTTTPPSDALLKLWIHLVPERYMALLSTRQPGALVIFAHYAVLLRRGEHYWFLGGLAERILRVAEAMVPGEWGVWLEWPREQIGGGGEGDG